MDDVSKLGPLWVSQLIKDVTRHRNQAAENLLIIKPEGDFAKQHRMLVDAANAMLVAPQMVAALREIAAINNPRVCLDGSAKVGSANAVGYDFQLIARAALAAAGA